MYKNKNGVEVQRVIRHEKSWKLATSSDFDPSSRVVCKRQFRYGATILLFVSDIVLRNIVAEDDQLFPGPHHQKHGKAGWPVSPYFCPLGTANNHTETPPAILWGECTQLVSTQGVTFTDFCFQWFRRFFTDWVALYEGGDEVNMVSRLITGLLWMNINGVSRRISWTW